MKKIVYILQVGILLAFFYLYFSKKISYLKNIEGNDKCEIFTFLPIESNVKIIGRYYQFNNVTWIVQSGSAIEFYVTGKSANVNIIGDSNIEREEIFRPRYAIYLDDKLFLDLILNELEVNIKLFEEEKEKTVKIKIILLSEAVYGGIGIKNINLNSCNSKVESPIKPINKKDLLIEFIGDSITCGYGVEAHNESENFTTSTENFSKSYAYLTSQQLNADYIIVAYSGYGIIFGDTPEEENEFALIPKIYTKTSKNEEYPGEWDFNKRKVDIIVINLGTNDSGYIKEDPEKRNDEFIQEYANFIKLVREKHQNSYILCTIGTMGVNFVYPLIEEAVKLVGDNKVSCFESPQQDSEDGLGANYHPSVKTHEKLSKLVSEKISNILGL